MLLCPRAKICLSHRKLAGLNQCPHSVPHKGGSLCALAKHGMRCDQMMVAPRRGTDCLEINPMTSREDEYPELYRKGRLWKIVIEPHNRRCVSVTYCDTREAAWNTFHCLAKDDVRSWTRMYSIATRGDWSVEGGANPPPREGRP
jgi:hypothetical protein